MRHPQSYALHRLPRRDRRLVAARTRQRELDTHDAADHTGETARSPAAAHAGCYADQSAGRGSRSETARQVIGKHDAEYLAIADLLGCRLVTLDIRLRRGADRLGFVITPAKLVDQRASPGSQ
ncbi:MAG: hypothetical protein ACYDHH_08705 [Solirubrobacteraceae bacterium]